MREVLTQGYEVSDEHARALALDSLPMLEEGKTVAELVESTAKAWSATLERCRAAGMSDAEIISGGGSRSTRVLCEPHAIGR